MLRRHLTDDQRMAAISKVRGPMLEKEAKARQAEGAKATQGKGESFKKNGKNGGPRNPTGEEAKSTPYKAQQAEKARKAGLIEDVIAKKMTLKQAAKAAGPSKRKPRKVQQAFEERPGTGGQRFLKKAHHPAPRSSRWSVASSKTGGQPMLLGHPKRSPSPLRQRTRLRRTAKRMERSQPRRKRPRLRSKPVRLYRIRYKHLHTTEAVLVDRSGNGARSSQPMDTGDVS